jgi:N-acetylmuramoyl-L-alanine amidase|nr:MAG TPA: Cell wall hydrolase autolysin [Caudoviricetes sp.]
MAKVFLSPSNQYDNRYAYGDTTEGVQCGKIAEACKAALERSGVTVKLMHDESMQEKCAASNAFGADLHVPIHTNAFNGTVSGTRMFYYAEGGEGQKACKAIFARLAPVTPGTSESIRADASLYEVRVPSAPTAYIECEFHDNPTASKWIVENTGLIGETIARGICDYFGVTFREKEQAQPAKSVDEVAREVIRGEWGNGSDRRQRLEAAGYDYNAVQDRVNAILTGDAPEQPTPAEPVEPSPEPEQPATDKLYRVQVGAFAVRENAEKMLQRLKGAGFEGYIREG